MPKVQDYYCRACGENYEFLHHPVDEPATCPECGSTDAEKRATGGTPLSVIVPTYPGSKKHKAGYVHSHGDRPAEKGSVAVPRTFKGERP